MLHVSPDWIWQKVRDRAFPHLRAGRTSVVFTAAHLDHIIELLEVPPIQEKSQPEPRGLTTRSARHMFKDH